MQVFKVLRKNNLPFFRSLNSLRSNSSRCKRASYFFAKPNRLSELFRHRFFRFLAVGLLNSLFGYSCYALFLYVGLNYAIPEKQAVAIALLLANIIGILFNFKTTGELVFKSNNNKLLFRFFTTYAVVYAVNLCLIFVLDNLGLNSYYSGAILIFPMAVLAYILNARFVFNHD